MKIKICTQVLLYIILTGTLGMLPTSSNSQTCNDGGLTATFENHDFTCQPPEIEKRTFNNGRSVGVSARVKFPVHNGEFKLDNKTLENCSFYMMNFRDGELIGGSVYPSGIPSSNNPRRPFSLPDLPNPFAGEGTLSCFSYSAGSPPDNLAALTESCRERGTFYIGLPKVEPFNNVDYGCPNAPIRPKSSPMADLEVADVETLESVYRVEFNNRSRFGRYNIAKISYEFGNGISTVCISGRCIDQKTNEFLHGQNNFTIDFDKDLGSSTAKITVEDVSGAIDSKTIDVFFTDPEKPVANFYFEIFGRELQLSNKSSHAKGDQLSYEWDFGDGNTASSESPNHIYEMADIYQVSLTVTDADGDEDTIVKQVEATNNLVINLSADAAFQQGEEETVSVTIYNYETSDINDLSINISTDLTKLQTNEFPLPPPPDSIPKNGKVSFEYTVIPKASGDVQISVNASGNLADSSTVAIEAVLDVYIDPEVDITFVSPAIEIVGEDAVFTLTITSNEDSIIDGLRVESLGLSTGNISIQPDSIVSYSEGPIGPNGVDPRVDPVSILPGETVIIVWRYKTLSRGNLQVEAYVSFDRPNTIGRVFQTAQTKLVIDSADMNLSNIRLQPNKPIPGNYSFIRGTITNDGDYDITNINFEIDDTKSTPVFNFIEELVQKTDSVVSPRIELLKPGESRDFIIAIGMELDIKESTSRYRFPIKFTGLARVDGETIDVQVNHEFKGEIDRTDYWFDILTQQYVQLIEGLNRILDEAEREAEVIDITAAFLGTTEETAVFLQGWGDGIFKASDLIIEEVNNGGERLTKQASKAASAVALYLENTTPLQRAVDLAELEEQLALGIGDITLESLDTFTKWMLSMQVAHNKGDTREVSRLMTRGALNVGSFVLGEVAAEQAAAKILNKLRTNVVARKALRKLRKNKVIPDIDTIENIDELILILDKGFDDLPTGTALTIDEAILAGLEGDDLAFMLSQAKKNNVTFFVRPRPASAAKWARLKYNAKPLSIKLKSVNDIDIDWLGFDAIDEGLIVLSEPTPPFKAITEALKTGRLDPKEDSALIKSITKRYHQKKADFENREKWIAEFNQTRSHTVTRPDPNFEGEFITETIEAKGKKVKRFGTEKVTTVRLDSKGRLIMDQNNLPVYSDIDLLSLAAPDGKNISPDLHERILKESGYGFDGQHHATAQTSDFPNAKVARNVAVEFMIAHSRGGEALLSVGPNGIRKVYVESFNIISADDAAALVNGLDPEDIASNYELYGKIIKSVRYTDSVD